MSPAPHDVRRDGDEVPTVRAINESPITLEFSSIGLTSLYFVGSSLAGFVKITACQLVLAGNFDLLVGVGVVSSFHPRDDADFQSPSALSVCVLSPK